MSDIGYIKSLKIMVKSRFKVPFVWTWATAVSCLIIGKGFPSPVPTILALVTTYLLATGVYIYNDAIDHKFDKMSSIKKNRPIPAGHVSVEKVKILAYMLVLSGILVSYFINFNTFLIALLYSVVWMSYSHPVIYTKRRFLMKDFTLASGFIILGLLGSYAVINTYSIQSLYASMILSILLFSVGPAISDTMDLEQDQENRVRNLASFLSWPQRVWLVIGGSLTMILMSVIGFIYLEYNILTPIFTTIIGFYLIYKVHPIINSYNSNQLQSAWKSVYVVFLLAHITLVLGSLNIPILF